MKRLALATVLAATAMTAATASADNTALGLSDSTEQQPVAMLEDGLHDAPDFNNQCGHWEYRTVMMPVWGYDYCGNYRILDYRYVTQRVWVYH